MGRASAPSLKALSHPRTTNEVLERFHEGGIYLAFERLLEDKVKKPTDSEGDMKPHVGGLVTGMRGGPSSYQGKRKP